MNASDHPPPGGPPAAPPPPPASPGPLSPAQLVQIDEAARLYRRATGAASLAAFNGWAAAIFAALSLAFILTGPTAGVMAAGLGLVAWNEFRGRRRVLRLDPSGPRLLGWNQLGLMGLLIAYGAWSLYSELAGPEAYEAELAAYPEMGGTLGNLGAIVKAAVVVVYGGLILLAMVFQGLTAAYYFSRIAPLRDYLARTPAWIVDLQRRLARA